MPLPAGTGQHVPVPPEGTPPAAGGAPAGARHCGWLLDREQLDVEDQRGIGRDARPTPRSVGQIRRDDQFTLAADLHGSDTLAPAFDDPVQREGDRLVALVGAVELGAVHQDSPIVHLDLVGRLGRGAVPFHQVHVHQA